MLHTKKELNWVSQYLEWSFTYGQPAIDKLTDINDHQMCPHFSPPTFMGENKNFERNNFEQNNFERNNFEQNNFERNNLKQNNFKRNIENWLEPNTKLP